jgi:putative glutamine amidotransferase
MINRFGTIIGISCCTKQFGVFGMLNHAASDTYVRAVDQVVGGVPILIPANGDAADIETLLDHCTGIILTGSRSNVAAEFYGGPPQPPDIQPEDPERDKVTLRLCRRAVARNIPLLAICRGMQELNVALGGTLHQRLQDLPHRIDHSTPMQENPAVRIGKAHHVTLTPGGTLAHRFGRDHLSVNSLHNQGVDRLAPGLAVEARAVDGTIEAIRVLGPDYALGVQWHPEYDFDHDPASHAIFASFGEAARHYSATITAR